MDERKNCRRSADSQGQRKYGRSRKDGRHPKLPQSVTKIAQKVLHSAPLNPVRSWVAVSSPIRQNCDCLLPY